MPVQRIAVRAFALFTPRREEREGVMRLPGYRRQGAWLYIPNFKNGLLFRNIPPCQRGHSEHEKSAFMRFAECENAAGNTAPSEAAKRRSIVPQHIEKRARSCWTSYPFSVCSPIVSR